MSTTAGVLNVLCVSQCACHFCSMSANGYPPPLRVPASVPGSVTASAAAAHSQPFLFGYAYTHFFYAVEAHAPWRTVATSGEFCLAADGAPTDCESVQACRFSRKRPRGQGQREPGVTQRHAHAGKQRCAIGANAFRCDRAWLRSGGKRDVPREEAEARRRRRGLSKNSERV